MTTQVTDDERVDVAADVVVATRIRAEHERVANACLALEDRAQLGDETDGSCVKVAEGRIQGIRRIHPPHSQRTDAPTFHESLPEQFLKGELYRPRAAVDPPNEIACMKLLARRTRQQREQAGLGRRTLDIGHDSNNTSVSDSDTDVSPQNRLPPGPTNSAREGESGRHAAPRGVKQPVRRAFCRRPPQQRRVLSAKRTA